MRLFTAFVWVEKFFFFKKGGVKTPLSPGESWWVGNNPFFPSPPLFWLCPSQSRTRWSRARARWWPSIAAVIRTRLRSALKPSSVPVSPGRSPAPPEPDPPVWKVKKTKKKKSTILCVYVCVCVPVWRDLSNSPQSPSSPVEFLKRIKLTLLTRQLDQESSSLNSCRFNLKSSDLHRFQPDFVPQDQSAAFWEARV